MLLFRACLALGTALAIGGLWPTATCVYHRESDCYARRIDKGYFDAFDGSLVAGVLLLYAALGMHKVYAERAARADFLARVGLAPGDPRVEAAYTKLTLEGRARVKSTGDLDRLLARRAELEAEAAAFEEDCRARFEELRLFFDAPTARKLSSRPQ